MGKGKKDGDYEVGDIHPETVLYLLSRKRSKYKSSYGQWKYSWVHEDVYYERRAKALALSRTPEAKAKAKAQRKSPAGVLRLAEYRDAHRDERSEGALRYRKSEACKNRLERIKADNADKPRPLKHGEFNAETGLRFWGYRSDTIKFEYWVLPEKFDELRAGSVASAKRGYYSPARQHTRDAYRSSGKAEASVRRHLRKKRVAANFKEMLTIGTKLNKLKHA